jgi:HK97 family phage prohead protease
MSELIIERDYEVTDLDVGRGDGWSLYGRIVPFGHRQQVRDTADGPTYLERFDPRAFDRDVAKGGRWVNLRVGHHGADYDAFLGRCLGLEALPGGLYGTFRIEERDHPLADAARAGELRSWSVGTKVFRSRKVTDPDGKPVVDRELCAINHVAATASPQYAGAGVLLVRDHQMIEQPAPRFDRVRAQLAADKARIARMSARGGTLTS